MPSHSLFITLLTSLLFALQVHSAAINLNFPRDNACTACLATITSAIAIPQILNCSVPAEDKKTIMLEQVCTQFNGSPIATICANDVEAWSPALYAYLMNVSQDPQVVCADEQFKSC